MDCGCWRGQGFSIKITTYSIHNSVIPRLRIVENYLKFPNILSAGEHDLTAREEFEFESKVKHFGYTTHNSYKEQRTLGVIEYDIAVLELVKPVDFDSYKHIR